MTDVASNGSYVSRAELAAHIKGIDEHFDSTEMGLAAVHAELRLVAHSINESLAKINDRLDKTHVLGPRGRSLADQLLVLLVVALVSGGISVAIALLLR